MNEPIVETPPIEVDGIDDGTLTLAMITTEETDGIVTIETELGTNEIEITTGDDGSDDGMDIDTVDTLDSVDNVDTTAETTLETTLDTTVEGTEIML